MRSGSALARRRRIAGFTMLELMVVIATIGILATMAMPALRNLPRRAHESALRTNLRTFRDLIDQRYGDKGQYPPALSTLVDEGYLRAIPEDITGSAETWVVIYEDEAGAFGNSDSGFPSEFQEPLPGEDDRGIVDVRSGSTWMSLAGDPYSDW